MLAERCFHALDHDRLEFHDLTGRCAVASAGAAAVGLGVCVLAAPKIVVVKTDNFDTYPPELRRIVIEDQVPELQHERALALACGFDFKVGVRSAAHKAALLDRDDTLDIVVMDWC